jgi:DnaJ-class molecular chaperone
MNVIHEGFFLSTFKELNIFLVGTGTVGGQLLVQISKQQNFLMDKHRLKLKVTGIMNINGMLFNENGIDYVFRQMKDRQDVYEKVVIKTEPHPIYKRQGLDILVDKTISLKEALCGFQMELEYLDGKKYMIKNVRGNIVGEGHRKTIAKMGLRRKSYVGSLHICFHIDFPATLSVETIEELEKRL